MNLGIFTADTTSLCKQGVDCREICNLEQALSGSCQENCSSFMESSTRTSSSSSTSCSSLKQKLSKDEPKSSARSPKNSAKTRSADINESPGFRESSKESIYNDLKNVSVKEKTEGVKKNKVLKPVDSPRPIDLSKMKELEESLEVLIKLRDLPRNLHEAGCSPRFSYDGRISTDIKQAITLKEKRRSSLDSMEDSLRCDLKSKVDSLMEELEKKSNYRISEASNLHQDLKSNGNHTSIVAKLMGLGPINSAGESCVKGHKPVNSQKKQESKYGNFLQSARNSPRSRSSINPHMKSDSSSRLVVKETLQKTVEYAEGNMRKKIEPVHNVIEKTLQKLEFQHNDKAIRDLRRVILERKNSGKTLRQTNTSEKSSISERALKSPFVGMKPESKSAGISSSQCSKLEVTSGLRKIKTSGSSDRKKEPFSVDGGQTPTGKRAKCMNSSANAKSRREGDNSVSPRLQRKGNPDQELKTCSVITSYDLKKNQKQSDNRQQLESVSPSSRVSQKSSKSQLNEGKSHLFHQTKRTNAASTSKHKQHQMLPREVFVEELEQISPQLSSPNSVLDASPYKDDLPLSPLSDSSTSNAEDENLLSSHTLNTTHLPQNLPSTSNFAKESQKLENTGTEVHEIIFPGSTTDNYTDPDNKYVAEVLLSSSLLTKDSPLSSMLKQIKLVDPLEAVEKNNTQVLHKQLVYDVVNEILARKLKAFNSGCQHDHLPKPNTLSLLLLFKELCLEVKHLQSSIDRNFQEKDTVFTKDLLRRSNAWDRFDSEVPSVVSEIESLIFIDLISEIIDSSIGTVLGTKQRYR